MVRILSLMLTFVLLGPVIASADDAASADDEQIESAKSAGPLSISHRATIKDWNMKVLRKGTNVWTCMPDNPNTPGKDPWCVNKPWLNFLDALRNKNKPTYTEVGIAFMMQGNRCVSNADPYATNPKPGDDWVEGLGPHTMMLLPDRKALKDMPTNSKSGGSWVMWPDTPYAHLMSPIGPYPPK